MGISVATAEHACGCADHGDAVGSGCICFETELGVADLRNFLQAEDAVLADVLERMASAGLLERADADKYALSALGQKEGRRRFADEFEEMLKPGHFECDEPDCDCHNPDAGYEACKHFSPAHAEHQHF